MTAFEYSAQGYRVAPYIADLGKKEAQMDADAGRVRTALRLQAVAARVHHMDCAGFAEEVCDAVDVAGRLGYLGCLHAVVRLAAAREAMPDADGMTCGELGCLAGLRRQARATDTLDADSFTARILAALDIKGWSDRSSYQIAAMRLADLIAPVSLMASPERTERGDRALYSYTCGRCGARVTVSVCTRCPSCGAPMVAAGHGAPVMKGAIHVDS